MLQIPLTIFTILNMAWMDIAMDWSVVADLRGFQALEVGPPIPHEVEGLAEGVALFNPGRLYVLCWGWKYLNTDLSRFICSPPSKSTLIMFLDALMTLDLRDGQAYLGLPSTLEQLVLMD